MLLGMQLLYILFIHTFVKRVNFNSLLLPCIMLTVAMYKNYVCAYTQHVIIELFALFVSD